MKKETKQDDAKVLPEEEAVFVIDAELHVFSRRGAKFAEAVCCYVFLCVFENFTFRSAKLV